MFPPQFRVSFLGCTPKPSITQQRDEWKKPRSEFPASATDSTLALRTAEWVRLGPEANSGAQSCFESRAMLEEANREIELRRLKRMPAPKMPGAGVFA